MTLQATWDRAKYRLTKSGRMYTLCIFHQEKTASLVIYPNGTFHCFGCKMQGKVAEDEQMQELMGMVKVPDPPNPAQILLSYPAK